MKQDLDIKQIIILMCIREILFNLPEIDLKIVIDQTKYEIVYIFMYTNNVPNLNGIIN